MTRSKRKRVLNLESLESRHLLTSFSTSLLKDITPGEASSSFSNFTPVGERLLFNVDADHLWITDGTTDGTIQLADNIMVDSRKDAADVDGIVTFHASNQKWKTDGTPEGTRQIEFEVVSRPGQKVTIEGEAYRVRTVGEEKWLYRSKGDDLYAEAIIQLPDIVVKNEIRALNGMIVFFVRAKPESDAKQPWVSDLTVEGTVPLLDSPLAVTTIRGLFPSPAVWHAEFEGVLLFGNRKETYRTDGSVEGTRLFHLGEYIGELDGKHYLSSIGLVVSTDGSELRTLNGKLYAPTLPGLPPPPLITTFSIKGDTIWRSIASTQQHQLAKLVDKGWRVVNSYYRGVSTQGGAVGNDGYTITNTDESVWARYQSTLSHGVDTILETTEIPWGLVDSEFKDTSTRFGFRDADTKPDNAPLLFSGLGLWALNGSRNMELLDFGADYREVLQNQHGNFFLVGENQLWSSDGTSETVAEIPIDSSPRSFVSWNDKTLLIASKEDHGEELWVIDGSYQDTPYEGLRAEVGSFALNETEPLLLDVEVFGVDQLSYAWDLNGDGVFKDALSKSPTIDGPRLVGLGVRPNRLQRIAVRIDSTTGQSIVESGFLRWDFQGLLTNVAAEAEADLDQDFDVDFVDFLSLSSNFGKTNATLAEGDADGDGAVTFTDFLILSANFGKDRNQSMF